MYVCMSCTVMYTVMHTVTVIITIISTLIIYTNNISREKNVCSTDIFEMYLHTHIHACTIHSTIY